MVSFTRCQSSNISLHLPYVANTAGILQIQECQIILDASILITGLEKKKKQALEGFVLKRGTKANNQPKEKTEQRVTKI